MGCGGECGCPQCEGRVPSGHLSVNALEWGLLAGQSRSGASDFWAAATTRTVFNSAVAGMPDADDVRAWVDGHAFGSADQSSFADTRYSSIPRGFGRPPPGPPPPPPRPDDDPPPGPGPLPPPRPGGKKPGWLTRDSWSYQRFGLPGPSLGWLTAGQQGSPWWFPQGEALRQWASKYKEAVRIALIVGSPFLGPIFRAGARTALSAMGIGHPWWWAEWSSLADAFSGVCCLREVHGGLDSMGRTAKSWRRAGNTAHCKNRLSVNFRAINRALPRPPCDCTCCSYRQFVSSRVVEVIEGFPMRAFDKGKELIRWGPYEEVDLTDIRADRIGTMVDLVDTWKPRVLKLPYPLDDAEYRKRAGGPGGPAEKVRYFYEDVAFFHGGKEIPAHEYFPSSDTEQTLTEKVRAYGRRVEPGMTERSPDSCRWFFEDGPEVGLLRGMRKYIETIWMWVASPKPGCGKGGLAWLGHGVWSFMCRSEMDID